MKEKYLDNRTLLELLEHGTSPYHAAEWSKKYLQEAGFTGLDFKKPFAVSEGGRYYVSPYPSCIFAFMVGKHFVEACKEGSSQVRLAMAHTDSPCFKIKSRPDQITKGYRQLNVEPYGGMIKSSWFDRPLGIAGKVVLGSEHVFAPKTVLFDSKEPFAVIPSLAPHMDREANQKRPYDMQTEFVPVVGMLQEGETKEDFLENYLAERLGVDRKELLAYDLYLYNYEKPEELGCRKEMLGSPRIDNLASVAALSEAIGEDCSEATLAVAACMDHEEIGSRSKQGADSMLLSVVLEKLGEGLGVVLRDALLRGFLLSVDGAHALHPNYVAKSDPTNEVLLGKGPVIKTSASQRYLSDSESTAILKQLCEQEGIPYQLQVNRSGMPGGQTLGPLVSSYLPMPGADVGIPMLAMHSARELAAGEDYRQLVQLLKKFFCL